MATWPKQMKKFWELVGLGKITHANFQAYLNNPSGAFGAGVIDCDADPFLPDGWSVESHRKGGQWNWDSEQIELWLSGEQKNGWVSKGNALRIELANQPVLNACVLDYLLEHPELIPEEWKGKFVFFWGTIYHDASGSLVVRYLGWRGSEWYWDCHWLDLGFHGRSPAAVSRK